MIAVAFLFSGTANAARVVIEGKVVNLHVQVIANIPGLSNPVPGLSFETTPRPPLTTGIVYQRFSVTEQTVPDADLRNTIISNILLAYASGKTVSVSYDDSGGFIDNRMYGIYSITVKD